MEALRDRFATTTPVERAAADGDLVSIDLTATVDGEVLDDAATEGLTYTVGAGDLVDGIDEAITGLSAGESATFTTVLVAGGFAGRDAAGDGDRAVGLRAGVARRRRGLRPAGQRVRHR